MTAQVRTILQGGPNFGFVLRSNMEGYYKGIDGDEQTRQSEYMQASMIVEYFQ